MVGIKKHKGLSFAGMFAMLAFFYAPILVMIVFSFNDSRSLTNFTGFSLQWYETLFNNREMMAAVQTTIAIALISTFVSTIAGTLAAIGLSDSKPLVKQVVLTINNLPIMNPEVVTAISLMILFTAFKVPRGFVTMLIAHIAFSIPYVILTVLPKLRRIDPNLTDAAMDLGATPSQALTKIIIPQIMPSVISAALLAFTMSFDDFVISYFVTGNGVKNISIMVYTMSKRLNPSINALSTIMVLVVTVFLVVINVVPMLNKNSAKRIKV
ncbi:spermidine/putrescine ABC transporter permease [Erysipelothrix larvae]|uniref:Spermidine/putrescine ABC transporter permease n=1 Tax=Erysipelothrix larvae TaxID=1514105 RepID=A0A0X8H1A0_9FIRM|nr:ABC transporter permease [Erysipelothrix larvae]AMC94191.1 spermidine/putrescine ABC transporter permease [Erysipelothrix larvae]